ncbi:MAG: class A beta-lactamase-related serine hydrolase [Candidatus Sumerlaeaceae bacterium]|nr:class A beta-lactamase-related serine hydrolase [Candidatus Sumerlaeaceae bacterium]
MFKTDFVRIAGIVLLLSQVAICSANELRNSEGYGRAITVTSQTTTFSKGWRGELERIVAAHRGVMGVSLKNLGTGESVEINADEEFPTASTIKLAVLCTVFDEMTSPTGRFPDYYLTRKYDEATSVGGAGFVKQFRNGTNVELKELVHFMITVSDNVATNMLVEWLGGLDSVNAWLGAHGFKATRMLATIGGKLVWNKELKDKWGIGVTTPNEMRRLMEMIKTGKAGSTTATDEMLRVLGHQYFDDGIAGEVPPGAWVGSKSGALNETRSDNAIVCSPGGTYVLSVYTKGNADKRWTSENEAENAIRAISRIVYRHYNPKTTWSRPAGAGRL